MRRVAGFRVGLISPLGVVGTLFAVVAMSFAATPRAQASPLLSSSAKPAITQPTSAPLPVQFGGRGGGHRGGGPAFHGGGGPRGGGTAFHGGGFRGAPPAFHGGGVHAAPMFRGGGVRAFHGGGPRFAAPMVAQHHYAPYRPHWRRHHVRPQFYGYYGPRYYGYVPSYYGPRRYCRIVWTYYGPRKICRTKPWRHHWRHHHRRHHWRVYW